MQCRIPLSTVKAYFQQSWRPILVSATILCALGLGLWALRPEPHDITVIEQGETLRFESNKHTVGEALAAAGVEIGFSDRVTPPVETPLEHEPSITVHVRRAVPVTISVDGQTHAIQSAASTVEQLLLEFSVNLSETDLLSVSLEQLVTPNLQVKVTRRTESVVVVEEEIPFDTIRREDRSMVIGETTEIQEGIPGILRVKRIIRYEDGKEVDAEVIESVIEPAQDRLVAYGTVGVVARGDQNYRFVKEMVMEATGYTAGKESNPDGNGYTYTGIKAVRGVVAVDPRVIPLNTRLFVDGYGPALAADIGGAIKGNKIDLVFDTVAEALQWGRRPVNVYILE